MNILIITPYYNQDKNIASLRWTNIAQRLASSHQVILVTQPLDDEMCESTTITAEESIVLARINQKSTYEKIAIKYFHSATYDDSVTSSAIVSTEDGHDDSLFRKAKNIVLYSSMRCKAKSYARYICNHVIPRGMCIDIVISSALPFIEMMVGYELKKRLGCKWISDFRDMPYHEEASDDDIRIKEIMCNDLRIADAVVTIAPKGREFLVGGGIVSADKVYVITNGYSYADSIDSDFAQEKDSIFRMVHTGSLYGGRRKPDILFKVMRSLVEEHPEVKMRLDVAGGNNTSLLMKAKEYNVDDLVTDHGFITRHDALKLQNAADCLVTLTDSKPGTLAAKLFEYTLCAKPIICITCGGMVDSDESSYINKANLGIAIEEARGEGELSRLYDFLLTQIRRKNDGKALAFNPNYDEIRKYDYDVIAKEYEDLCQRVLKR